MIINIKNGDIILISQTISEGFTLEKLRDQLETKDGTKLHPFDFQKSIKTGSKLLLTLARII